MQTINTNEEPIKVYGNFDKGSSKLLFRRDHVNGGGASGNGLYSSLTGTPTDLMGDKPTYDIGIDRDDSGGGLGDEPILPDIKPPIPIDPAIKTMVSDDQHKEIGKLFLVLVVVAILVYFLIKTTAE